VKTPAKARRFATQILYQMSPVEHSNAVVGFDLDRILLDFWSKAGELVKPEIKDLTEHRVRGVLAEKDKLDVLIEKHSQNWRLDRMSPVDLAILRLSSFELLSTPEVPTGVCIDEAIMLAKQFSTSDAPAFINGILDAMAKDLRPLPVESNL